MGLAWKIEFTETADKQLKKLDKQCSKRLLKWLEDRITNCSDPKLWGEALQENRKEQWRYRVGDYRIICEIQNHRLIVRVIEIGHRKEVYR